jgi:short-subunit dehydrogenase
MTVTLLTGASSGIGRSLARRLAAGGDPVALLARREPLLQTLVQEIEAAGRTRVDDFRAAHVEQVLALNVGGTANCFEAVLPGMLARGAGHLVAVGSLAAYRGLPDAAAYSAAKAALSNLVESLRIDLAPRGVDVTLLLPGFVRADPSRRRKRRKPFQLELEDATGRMERAIRARRRRYAFPWPLVLAMGVGRAMPAPLYDRLLSGGSRPKGHGERKR